MVFPFTIAKLLINNISLIPKSFAFLSICIVPLTKRYILFFFCYTTPRTPIITCIFS